jgi:hypothetical protein
MAMASSARRVASPKDGVTRSPVANGRRPADRHRAPEPAAGAPLAQGHLSAQLLIQLQRTLGNRAVTRLLGMIADSGQVRGHASELRPSGGQALDYLTRHAMEMRFGHDFSAVRVHIGARAAEAAGALDASAYTVNHDIVFGDGHAPGTIDGERRLVHELTHVVQQTAAGGGPPGSAHEREAHALADRSCGGQLTVTMASQAGVPQLEEPTLPTLPKFNRRQQARMRNILSKLSEHDLTFNDVGFGDKRGLADFLKARPADEALDALEAKVDKTIDRKQVAAQQQRRGAPVPEKERVAPGSRIKKEPTSPERGRLPRATTIRQGETFGTAGGGNWDGAPGNSRWHSDRPEVIDITKDKGVLFKNGHPKFEEWAKHKVYVKQEGTDADFAAANRAFAKSQGWLKPDGTPNAAAADRHMQANNLTWHHVEDGKTMVAVPYDLHKTESTPHIGGASGARTARSGAPPKGGTSASAGKVPTPSVTGKVPTPSVTGKVPTRAVTGIAPTPSPGAKEPLIDPLMHAVMIMELMSAAERAHAQLLDRASKTARDAAIIGAKAIARTVAARLPPGTPLWLNLTLRARETYGGGYLGLVIGGPDIPDDAKVQIFRFSIDPEPRPAQPRELNWDRGTFESTQDTEWTEAILLPNSSEK